MVDGLHSFQKCGQRTQSRVICFRETKQREKVVGTPFRMLSNHYFYFGTRLNAVNCRPGVNGFQFSDRHRRRRCHFIFTVFILQTCGYLPSNFHRQFVTIEQTLSQERERERKEEQITLSVGQKARAWLILDTSIESNLEANCYYFINNLGNRRRLSLVLCVCVRSPWVSVNDKCHHLATLKWFYIVGIMWCLLNK